MNGFNFDNAGVFALVVYLSVVIGYYVVFGVALLIRALQGKPNNWTGYLLIPPYLTAVAVRDSVRVLLVMADIALLLAHTLVRRLVSFKMDDRIKRWSQAISELENARERREFAKATRKQVEAEKQPLLAENKQLKRQLRDAQRQIGAYEMLVDMQRRYGMSLPEASAAIAQITIAQQRQNGKKQKRQNGQQGNGQQQPAWTPQWQPEPIWFDINIEQP